MKTKYACTDTCPMFSQDNKSSLSDCRYYTGLRGCCNKKFGRKISFWSTLFTRLFGKKITTGEISEGK